MDHDSILESWHALQVNLHGLTSTTLLAKLHVFVVCIITVHFVHVHVTIFDLRRLILHEPSDLGLEGSLTRSQVRLVRDNERVQVLVGLHTKELVLLALGDLQQLLDLLLLAHLSLLLLLFQLLFNQALLLNQPLLSLDLSQPRIVSLMHIAAFAMVDCDEECGGRGVVTKLLLLLLMQHELLELCFALLPRHALLRRRDDLLLLVSCDFGLSFIIDAHCNRGRFTIDISTFLAAISPLLLHLFSIDDPCALFIQQLFLGGVCLD